MQSCVKYQIKSKTKHNLWFASTHLPTHLVFPISEHSNYSDQSDTWTEWSSVFKPLLWSIPRQGSWKQIFLKQSIRLLFSFIKNPPTAAHMLLKFWSVYFIYFWLHWDFIAAHGLSLVAKSMGLLSKLCARSSLLWLLICRASGFSSCSSQALEFRVGSHDAQG